MKLRSSDLEHHGKRCDLSLQPVKFLSWGVYFRKATSGCGKTEWERIREAEDQETSWETIASDQVRDNRSDEAAQNSSSS